MSTGNPVTRRRSVETIHRALPDMVIRPDIRWRLEAVWVVQELANRLGASHRLPGKSDRQWSGGRYALRMAATEGDHTPAHRRPCGKRGRAPASPSRRRPRLRYCRGAREFGMPAAATLAHQLGMGACRRPSPMVRGRAMGLHVAACMANLTLPGGTDGVGGRSHQ